MNRIKKFVDDYRNQINSIPILLKIHFLGYSLIKDNQTAANKI